MKQVVVSSIPIYVAPPTSHNAFCLYIVNTKIENNLWNNILSIPNFVTPPTFPIQVSQFLLPHPPSPYEHTHSCYLTFLLSTIIPIQVTPPTFSLKAAEALLPHTLSLYVSQEVSLATRPRFMYKWQMPNYMQSNAIMEHNTTKNCW